MTLALEGIWVSLSLLARIAVVVWIVLDVLLEGQGRACTITTTHSCTWINTLALIGRSILKLKEKSTWFCRIVLETLRDSFS